MEDIVATRDLLEAARPDEIGVSVSYPLPGTKFHELVKAQLGGKTHWQESNDLEMMFHGTYTSDFYRSIRDLLHEQVALQMRRRRRKPHDRSSGAGRSSSTTNRTTARAPLERRSALTWARRPATPEDHATPALAAGGVGQGHRDARA